MGGIGKWVLIWYNGINLDGMGDDA